jgi:hypothetical protein
MGRALEFYGYLSPFQKLFDFIDFDAKCPLDIWGEGIFPSEKFFIDETPKGNPRGLRHRVCKSVQRSGL